MIEPVYATAPFPYFGSKSVIAADIWAALGDVAHYIEPFFGSGAVLLNRPDWQPRMTETICDKDSFISNVWRALQADPDAVAKVCDFPVNHADLIARKAALIRNENYLLKNLCRDEKWFDVELAGYWIWAASCWIGSGLTCPNQIPHIGHAGMGIHAKDQIPHISDTGKGVHAKGQIPHISDAGKGVQDPYNTNLYEWFRRLSERLRYVRVVCGDWTRVCGGAWQTKIGTCGIFFDPPYGVQDRDTDVYHCDSTAVAADVEKWCLERGGRETYRIVVAGYSDEYKTLVDAGWRTLAWKAQGGYANIARSGETQGKLNRHREMLFFSPHCVEVKRLGQEVIQFDAD